MKFFINRYGDGKHGYILQKINEINEYANWIDSELRPNVYVVGTLKQRTGAYFKGSWMSTPGTQDLYGASYDQFIRRLTIACYGKTNWERHKRLLPNASTIEGNGNGTALGSCSKKPFPRFPSEVQSGDRHVRYHLNILLRKPDWIPFETFKTKIKAVWAKNPWAMPDIYIEERTGDCVSYSLKEGPESLLANSMSF